MDKKILRQYTRNKSRLKRLDKRIQDLCAKDIEVVSGKVVGSSKNFPYTEVRTTVQMYDPEESDKVDRDIRQKEAERLAIQSYIDEADEYITAISDPEMREIFELYYQEGKTQQEVAKIVGLERSSISKKITDYLKLSHYSQK